MDKLQNNKAEISLLNLMINNKITPSVPADYFVDENNRLLYEYIKSISEEKQIINIPNLVTKLESNNVFYKIGGESYIEKVKDYGANTDDSEYYVETLSSIAGKNSFIEMTDSVKEAILSSKNVSQDLGMYIDDITEIVNHIEQKKTYQDGYSAINDYVSNIVTEAQQVEDGVELNRYIYSGFDKLDDITGGFAAGEFIIIAARPAMGKSAFVFNLAVNSAIMQKKSVALFSLEMSNEQVMDRILAKLTKIPTHKITNRLLGDYDRGKLQTTVNKFNKFKFYLDDTADLNMYEFCDKARQVHKDHQLDILFVDYLQLIKGGKRYKGNLYAETTEVSKKMKLLAKELNIPIVALCQLSRSVESRANKIPVNSDLRDSGSLEQDADKVLLLYRSSYYDKDFVGDSSDVDIIVSKNRTGKVGTCTLNFNASIMTFNPYQ